MWHLDLRASGRLVRHEHRLLFAVAVHASHLAEYAALATPTVDIGGEQTTIAFLDGSGRAVDVSSRRGGPEQSSARLACGPFLQSVRQPPHRSLLAYPPSRPRRRSKYPSSAPPSIRSSPSGPFFISSCPHVAHSLPPSSTRPD